MWTSDGVFFSEKGETGSVEATDCIRSLGWMNEFIRYE